MSPVLDIVVHQASVSTSPPHSTVTHPLCYCDSHRRSDPDDCFKSHLQTFDHEGMQVHVQDPRELFKQAISDRKRRREALQSMHRPGGYRRDPHFAPAPRLPPALPGIVGGDYDRLPPSLANMPMHAWGSGHGCVAPMMQAQEHHVSGTTGGVLGRAARREAGIGGGLGDRMHGPGGRAFGSNAGFGGFGGGPFRGRPF